MKIPTPAEVLHGMGRSSVESYRPMPLHDRSPDPGLFGPDSVTWRVMREPLLMLGAGRALLMQAANPLVAQGAIDHSNYATDPYGRLERTVEWVTVVSFGTTAEAERASAHVVRLHRHVRGSLPGAHATTKIAARTRYTAGDPALLRWVHASFVETMLSTHDALVGGLDDGERDAFVREWDAVAALMGVPRRLLWRDARAMRAYVAREVERGPAQPGPGSRRVAETVLRPPVSSPAMRPAAQVLAFIAVGLLPDAVRRGYGLTWTPAHAAAHRAIRVWLRSIRPTMPRRLRISPVHELALARTRGRWPERMVA
ncbi:MAG TPA: oxygenase MpaB family protein [Candidatus Dormibacteraeota bacterium]